MRIPLSPFLLVGALAAHAQDRWLIEAESKQVGRHKAVQVVADASASGGQAIAVPVEGVSRWNVVHFSMPAKATPGRYQLDAFLQQRNAADIGKAWRIDVRQDRLLLGYGVAYGLYLRNGTGYQPFTVEFEWTDPKRHPAVYMRWAGKEGSPDLRLDRFEIVRLGDLPPLRIAKVWPDKVRYKTSEKGTVTVTVENLSARPQDAQIRLELLHDLAPPCDLGALPIHVEPGQTTEVAIPLDHGGELFGYAIRATLVQGERKLDEAEEYFCVHDNPWAVATGARDEELPDYYSVWHHVFYSIGATDPGIEECAQRAREEYRTCTEFFSWAPGEAFGLTPKEEIWVRGNGGNLLRSKREIQREVAALQRHGIACITYIAYQAMGEATVKMIQERPEWFAYSADTGDHVEWYRVHELHKQREFWAKFDWERYRREAAPASPAFSHTQEGWKRYELFWKPYREQAFKLSTIGYFVPNYKLPEVVDYCADQAIASAKMFGWDGLRWDCGHLNTGPVYGPYRPYLDFFGRPLAETPEEMEQHTIANLKRLKARVRKELPLFAIGTNFGSVRETRQYPEMAAELCREGGWMLDEVCYGYNAPQSPYHWWDKYYEVMAAQGEYITSRGGHYHPFSFNRNGGKYPADRLYETVFRLAGNGHPNVLYFNSCTPCGNFSQFCVRFGRFLFDRRLRRVSQPRDAITVSGSAPLWWDKTVHRLKRPSKEVWVLHLINPPVAKEVETDPNSRLNPPVDDVQVQMHLPADRQQVSAWTLSAESWTLGERPRTQAVVLEAERQGDRVRVTVPQVLYWKTLVFELR